ncbi:hypothetical protein GOV08_04965 [Candidatus Woesearchaeota archaeon]|nr:hypothetical protein [Candidatus Woesearchaeota archaeon]
MSGGSLFEKFVNKFDNFILWFYERWSLLAIVIAIFLIGFIIGVAAVQTAPDRQATSSQNTNLNPLTGFVAFNPVSDEVNSPFDWIKEEQIHVYNDRVVIDLKDAEWATFTDTNSMDPVIDFGSNAIEIVPKSTEDIHIGDIISYKSKYSTGTVIHRVVEIGSDDEGWYAKTKGDNNDNVDPGKIRFSQVQRVVVAVIY